MNKKRVLIVFGTRPEAIKMIPVYFEFKKYEDVFEVKICVTGQHRKMLDQVLDFFEVIPEYDLDVMEPNQSLNKVSSRILNGLDSIFILFDPDYVFVHGDTTTSMVASLAAFNLGIKVCHVEAGLRTNNKYSPFPEELNRQITARIADIHFAPTLSNKNNLIKENIKENSIILTGNTVIDALFVTLKKLGNYSSDIMVEMDNFLNKSQRTILITAHRRENLNNGMGEILDSIRELALFDKDLRFIFPVHLNPNVRALAHKYLSGLSNVRLIEPLAYPDFVWLMNRVDLIITDSGGIQEEAPSLGKVVLVTRESTERQELMYDKRIKIVGNNGNLIFKSVVDHFLNYNNKSSMASDFGNPYGNGKAAERIVQHILEYI